MPERRFLETKSERLARAIEGRGLIDNETAPLLGIASRLYGCGAAPVPPPTNVAAARLRMLGAVNEQTAARAAASHGAKVRGATLGAAAVAGAGLLMASAATNSDPVGIVRTTVLEFPAMVMRSDAPTSEDVTLVGTIVSVDEAGKRVELDTGETRVAVDVREVPSERPADTAPPVIGSVVEIDGSVREGDATVRAKEVTVKEPAAAVSLAPTDRNDTAGAAPSPEPTTTQPAVVADSDAAASVKPPTPTATPTPRGDDANVKPSIVANATPRPTMTATPSATPTATATPTLKPRPTPTPPAIDPVPPDDSADADNSNLVESGDDDTTSQEPATGTVSD